MKWEDVRRCVFDCVAVSMMILVSVASSGNDIDEDDR